MDNYEVSDDVEPVDDFEESSEPVADKVRLVLEDRQYSGFKTPRVPGVVVTQEQTEVDADQAEAIIEDAARSGILVRKVAD